jgi:hypothetical protein
MLSFSNQVMIVSLNLIEIFESSFSRDLVMILTSTIAFSFLFANSWFANIKISFVWRFTTSFVAESNKKNFFSRKKSFSIVFQIDLNETRMWIERWVIHIDMKQARVVNWLNHFKLIDVITEICDESMIVYFQHFIKRFHHLENVVRRNIKLFNQLNKWIYIKIAIQKRRWLHVCLNNVFEI